MLSGTPLPTALVVVWLSLVTTGFSIWANYDARPGLVESPRPTLVRSSGRSGWDLVLFVHPHCPCTRATLAELTELVHEAGPGLKARVVFVRPTGVPEGWERGTLWTKAAGTSGVELSSDEGGDAARSAGAVTSGHAILCDEEGRVVFRGGLTRGRGQVGVSEGRRAVLTLRSGLEAPARSRVTRLGTERSERFSAKVLEAYWPP